MEILKRIKEFLFNDIVKNYILKKDENNEDDRVMLLLLKFQVNIKLVIYGIYSVSILIKIIMNLIFSSTESLYFRIVFMTSFIFLIICSKLTVNKPRC